MGKGCNKRWSADYKIVKLLGILEIRRVSIGQNDVLSPENSNYFKLEEMISSKKGSSEPKGYRRYKTWISITFYIKNDIQ